MKKIYFITLILCCYSKAFSQSWFELGSGNNALNANLTILSICTDSAGNIYAAGDFSDSLGRRQVVKWDGTAWHVLGVGNNSLNANAWIKSVASDIIPLPNIF